MDIDFAINNRRSVRKFKSQPVEEEKLLLLAKFGGMAPTASNLQGWKFIFVRDEKLVKKIEMFSPGISGHPPVIIAVCTDLSIKGITPHNISETCIIDASMAGENIMLKAVDLGLGTCAIKSYHEEAVRKLLKLPSHIRLEFLISLGYPDCPLSSAKKKGTEETTFFDTWEER